MTNDKLDISLKTFSLCSGITEIETQLEKCKTLSMWWTGVKRG